jgi:hypothetical protein
MPYPYLSDYANELLVGEDFAEAKRLKLQISHYKQVGTQLADLERRKALAVKNEDFDAALQIKVYSYIDISIYKHPFSLPSITLRRYQCQQWVC